MRFRVAAVYGFVLLGIGALIAAARRSDVDEEQADAAEAQPHDGSPDALPAPSAPGSHAPGI